ncbi:hypothetical protein DEDE109153_07500 [Deinococcus deserti]
MAKGSTQQCSTLLDPSGQNQSICKQVWAWVSRALMPALRRSVHTATSSLQRMEIPEIRNNQEDTGRPYPPGACLLTVA